MHKADVIVYGGTSAGVIAAVQASRMGKSVILISPECHLGGMSSSGLGWTDLGNKEVIGGLAREFYHRVFLYYQKPEAWSWQDKSDYGNQGQSSSAIDPIHQTMWVFEPHVAEEIFNKLIDEQQIPVFKGEYLQRNGGVNYIQQNIFSIQMLSGKVFSGKVFIDATYEGDLMATAGVSYVVGREPCNLYNEEWNGVQIGTFHHPHYFTSNISAFDFINRDNDSLPLISQDFPGYKCQGDKKIQAYCFRLCLTRNLQNKVPLKKPECYDPRQYELLARVFQSGWRDVFLKFDPLPNYKTDANNYGPFSFDYIGMNYEYPEGSYEIRHKIIKKHEVYQKGLLYFIATDPRVPADVQKEMNEWGYAMDEFTDNGNWPYLLYIREARRMVGAYVMTENDILGKTDTPDSIAMGSYTMDSHNVQRYIQADGFVQNEGDVGIHPPNPYKIALGSIMPKKEECWNLIVPVAVSSSHSAFGSIRMEPVFMELGQSAATLACMAIDQNKSIQEVSYGDLEAQLKLDEQIMEWPED